MGKVVIYLFIGSLFFLISAGGVINGLYGLGLQVREVIYSPFAGLSVGLGSIGSAIVNLQGLTSDNARLQQEITSLSASVRDLEELRNENDYLRRQLGIETVIKGNLVLAKVVRYEFFPVAGYLYVDTSGLGLVSQGDYVVSFGYLVGQIEELKGQFARVRLVSATDTQIPVVVGDLSIPAMLVGRGGIDLSLDNVPIGTKIKEGDSIRLLNPASLVLENILIGYVENISIREEQPLAEVGVKSPLSLYGLDYVLVLNNAE